MMELGGEGREGGRCLTCSAALTDDAVFCTECGTPVRPALKAEAHPGTPQATRSGFCVHCGRPMPEAATFCTDCGKPRPGVEETGSARRSRSGWVLGALAVVVVAGAGAFYWWSTIAPGEPDPSSTAVAGPEDPATDLAPGLSGVDCDVPVNGFIDSLRSWAPSVPNDLSILAPAPGPPTSPGCDEATVRDKAADQLEAALASGEALTVGELALLADPADAYGAIADAFASHPGSFQVSAYDLPIPQWVVILESLPVAEFPQSEAVARSNDYRARFDDVVVIGSDGYQSLRAGYSAIIATGFSSFDNGLTSCRDRGLEANECYPRLLQDLSALPADPQSCGPYGRVIARRSADVQLHPRASAAEVRGAVRAGQVLTAASYSTSANGGLWILLAGPFNDGNRMGWVPADAVDQDLSCVGKPQVPEVDSCGLIVADLSAELAAPSPDTATFEMIAIRIGRSVCDVSLVNQAGVDALLGVTSSSASERLRSAVWSQIEMFQS